MKKIIVKRLIYTNGDGVSHIGGSEYDGALTNDNILGAIHEVGKTQWIGSELWLMKNGIPVYHITVEPFVQYQKTVIDTIIDMLRRI